MTTSSAPTARAVESLQFRDKGDQAAFESQGYLIGPDLEPDRLERLRALWEEVGPHGVHGIWSNVHVLDPEVNRRVDREVTEAFRPLVEQVMVNGRLAGASFLVKGVGEGSASELHQDWNNVDERVAISVSMWCPLVDVDEENGALQVLPGSHLLRHTVRALDTPSLTIRFDEAAEQLRAVPLPAGRCVFYAHNLFHGSRPNDTDRIRVAVTSGVLPEGARHLHYRNTGPHTFEELEVERDFFFSGIPDLAAGRLPGSAHPAGTVAVPGGQLSLTEVLGSEHEASVGNGTETDGSGPDPTGSGGRSRVRKWWSARSRRKIR